MAGKIITIAQQKGGAGKTMLAAHLAVAWSMAGRRVAVLDVDPQGSLGQWFERREDWLGEDGIDLGFRTASGWGARREAKVLARDHDLVVVDTAPHADREARSAMEQSTLVVVPVQPTPSDLWATAATLKLAAQERVPAAMVLNRVPPRARLTDEIATALAELGAPLLAARLGNRVAFAASFGDGRTVLEIAGAGRASDEAEALAREVRRGADA